MILNFRTDRSGQTVQTQNGLLLEEQSDQGLHCLPVFDKILSGLASLFEFQVKYSKVSCIQKLSFYTVWFVLQGVKFMYDCATGVQIPDNYGCIMADEMVRLLFLSFSHQIGGSLKC